METISLKKKWYVHPNSPLFLEHKLSYYFLHHIYTFCGSGIHFLDSPTSIKEINFQRFFYGVHQEILLGRRKSLPKNFHRFLLSLRY